MKITLSILMVIWAITIMACGNSQDNTIPVDKLTALEQMEIAFDGGYSTAN